MAAEKLYAEGKFCFHVDSRVWRERSELGTLKSKSVALLCAPRILVYTHVQCSSRHSLRFVIVNKEKWLLAVVPTIAAIISLVGEIYLSESKNRNLAYQI